MVEASEDDEPITFQVVCLFGNTGSTYMILEQASLADASTEPDFSSVSAQQISRLIEVQEYGAERIFVSHTRGLGSSAALSSSNAAGGGVLVKAYAAPGADSATVWDDTKCTYVGIWPRFLGMPDDQSSLFGGLMAPVYSELSGVIMFSESGMYEIRLHCEGWCALYIYGEALHVQCGTMLLSWSDAKRYALQGSW
jgi:hypothetical protein